MLKAVLVLVYLIGMCNQFGALLTLDSKRDYIAPCIDYFILSLFWPITVWWWMYRNYKFAWRRRT